MINSSQETIIPPTPLSGDGARSSWKNARKIAEEFKFRWEKEYLLSLRNREKWKSRQTEIPKDSLVLIEDKEAHRPDWKKGRVIQKLSDSTYQILNGKGQVIVRHHNQLVPLELD